MTQTYGDQLVRVRYRYDEERRKRCKTAEVIVEEISWVTNNGQTNPGAPAKSDTIVSVRVGYVERHIRNLIKEAGGKWSSTGKVWSLTYRKAVEFGLEKRIV